MSARMMASNLVDHSRIHLLALSRWQLLTQPRWYVDVLVLFSWNVSYKVLSVSPIMC